MLDALEIAGFKSFPDRTRFDFPPGITVVVGPNGSGKSNIVDAIKWVLGEQSAKSLRGKEMADVIFKGSGGPSGRRASNSAEATIFLDNRERRLRLDQDEITVTRRVYRSGEGEYMINGEPCRLKDIRNMFRGTGIGVDAYSLIEQGKIDQVLQASAKDRRAMFEEAAGISRFKAKKIETERRLGRVEQNLIRLSDIVEEVEGNYKRIKNQASKASKYKEYTDRLRSLRTHVGQKDWRDFSRTLQEIADKKQAIESELVSAKGTVQQLEEESAGLDEQLSENSSAVAAVQKEMGGLLQVIAERQSEISLAQTRLTDQDNQSRQLRETLEKIVQKLSEGFRSIESSQSELTSAENEFVEIRKQLEDTDGELTDTNASVESSRQSIVSDRNEFSSLAEEISVISQEVSVATSQQTTYRDSRTRLTESVQELGDAFKEKQAQAAKAQQVQDDLKLKAEEKDSTLRAAREKVDKTKDELENEKKQLAKLQREQVGATQRAELIQELENQQAGVDSGVKELIAKSKEDPASKFGDVIGLVADLIKVNVEQAELIDLALGETAQYVVVQGDRLQQAVADGEIRLSGRVGLVLLEPEPDKYPADKSLHDQVGVVGRLDQLVQAKAEHHAVIRHLLGNTWLVKSLTTALNLRLSISNPRTRLVTLEGEIVEPDGTVLCGSKVGNVGIVSRRSELRVLHRRLHELAQTLRISDEKVQKLSKSVKVQNQEIDTLLTEHSEISDKLNESRTESSLVENEMAQLTKQLNSINSELKEVTSKLDSVDGQLSTQRKTLEEKQSASNKLQEKIKTTENQLVEGEKRQQELQQLVTTAKVAFAKSEQHVRELQSLLEMAKSQIEENESTKTATRSQLADLLWQRRKGLRLIDSGETELVEFNSKKQTFDEKLEGLNEKRQSADQKRRENATELTKLRDQLRTHQDSLHEFMMREKDLSMQRTQLAERLREDYEIDIDQLETEQGEFGEDRSEIDNEINDLRKKLNNIGPVNMDALAELEEVEQRYELLSTQYADLIEAKETLEKIITRINLDSRRLFVETLEQIRENFQTLFRQAFGGGKADLIIEEGVDVLDAGVDITATPPGKPEFNNSLLSGGEKALTAVSLLMAIFKFRPSPFCILDEVDAPFDEANVGRFIETLRSFLGWTKFIIVTHSKKTMTAATTLYGVTMQESGVSKRVSVRFEDVNDKGEISESAVKRSDESGDSDRLGVA